MRETVSGGEEETISGAYCRRRNTIGVDNDEEERAPPPPTTRRSSVEFRMPGGRSVHADLDRLAVLGMTKCPEVVDVTQMSVSAGAILERILTGDVSQRVSMRDAAELAHVANELKLKSLLKLMEEELVGRRHETTTSVREAVDALCLAQRFGMTEAVGKLVDDIVFGGLVDEQLVLYCKSERALDAVMKRKAELMAEQDAAYGQEDTMPPPLDYFPDIPPSPPPYHPPPNSLRSQLAVRTQNANQQYKIIVNAAKQKLRTMMTRPMAAIRDRFTWINRRRPAAAANRDFRNFHEQF